MFRLPIGERVDPAEERRRVRANTFNSVATFLCFVAAIRLTPFLVERIQMAI